MVMSESEKEKIQDRPDHVPDKMPSPTEPQPLEEKEFEKSVPIPSIEPPENWPEPGKKSNDD